jgi:hypothetical protein
MRPGHAGAPAARTTISIMPRATCDRAVRPGARRPDGPPSTRSAASSGTEGRYMHLQHAAVLRVAVRPGTSPRARHVTRSWRFTRAWHAGRGPARPEGGAAGP